MAVIYVHKHIPELDQSSLDCLQHEHPSSSSLTHMIFFVVSKQWYKLFVNIVDLVLTLEILERVSFVKSDGEELLGEISK